MFNIFKKKEPEIIEKIVEVEKIIEVEKQYEETLEEQLAYVNIKDRRPFNAHSFDLEKLIKKVLSSEKDTQGKSLVKLTCYLFETMGYEVKNNDGFNDKKKDVLVYRKNEDTPFLAIQCKSYSPKNNHQRIMPDEVSQFIGWAEEFGKNRIFLTTSFFEKKTIDNFSEKAILIDRVGLINLLLKHFPKETVNALNTFSLYDIKDNCEKCQIGKLQEIRYERYKNTVYKCTNCGSKYKIKGEKLDFIQWDKY